MMTRFDVLIDLPDADSAKALATQLLAKSKGAHYANVPDKFRADDVNSVEPNEETGCPCPCPECIAGDCGDCTNGDCDFEDCDHGDEAAMLGILERSTNNNIEQQALEFIQYTMLPWVTRWEQELNRKLFAGTSFYVKFDMDGLLRGDFLSRMQGYQILRNSGIASANFVNAKEGWNLIPADQGGDIVLAPLNMTPLSELAKQKSEPLPQQPDDAPTEGGKMQQAGFARAFAHLFADATGRMMNRDKRDEA